MSSPEMPAGLSGPEKRAWLAKMLEEKARAPRTMPTSFAQERLWFLDQLAPGTSVYNVPAALRVRATLSLPALEKATAELVRRHESLRTTFGAQAGKPVQVVHPAALRPLACVSLAGLPPEAREAEAGRRATEEARRPFDLARGPLLRATLLTLAPDDHVLLLTMHHIVSDGWSMGVLLRELPSLYDAFCADRPSPLAPLPITYGDYAAWQRAQMAGPRLHEQIAYWREALLGAPLLLDLPTDRPRPPVQSFRGALLPFTVARDVAARGRELARQEKATPFMVLLAAFGVLLARHAGQREVLVGSPIAGRTRAELEGLVGFFVNTLVLRVDLRGNPTFRELVARVRETTLGAYAHQDLPFEKLVEELEPRRSLGQNPLFQAMFSLAGAGPEGGAGDAPPPATAPIPGTSKFDLTLSLAEGEQGISAAFEYATDLFDTDTIQRLAARFQVLLGAATSEPSLPVLALPMLPAAELDELARWNDTHRDVERTSVPERIRAQAQATPDAPAVTFEGATLSYRALDDRAERLAGGLASLGVGPEVTVAVCLDRSIEMVVALLAVLYAGGAYVPLDPSYPRERLAFMLEDAGPAVLLTDVAHKGMLPASADRVVLCIDDVKSLPPAAARRALPARMLPGSAAYVIYTSGSTGLPKAAVIPHEALLQHMLWLQATCPLLPADAVLHRTPVSFDVSVWELFWPLMTGARLVVARPGGHRDTGYVAQLVQDERITVAYFVASMLGLFAEHPASAACTSLRHVFCGGEPLAATARDRLLARLPRALLHNIYGPTETTIDVTSWTFRHGDGQVGVPIGEPVHNTTIHVLDDRMQPVPVGVTGELHVGGALLGRGYLRRPAMTAKAFVPDPFAGEAGARLYRTGDLGRRRRDGALELVGRRDDQVKIRGFRVELGEIEATLRAYPPVSDAVVLVREDTPGDKRLVGYVVSTAGDDLEPALRAHCAARLPEPMIPPVLVRLERLPLSPSGKVDRSALPAPDHSARSRPSRPPRTPVERQLAMIWARLLGRDDVGLDHGFFELGGHSLLATQLVSRVRDAFGVELPLRDLFESPTLEDVARAIAAASGDDAPTPDGAPGGDRQTWPEAGLDASQGAIARREARAPVPASFAQERLWFLARLDPESPAYNVAATARLGGVIDAGALARAITLIVQRHEALRTTFVEAGGRLSQVVHAPPEIALASVDLRGFPASQRDAEASQRASIEAQRPFDLARGPLLRCTWMRLDETDHLLLLVLHHIVSDEWSMDLFFRELEAAYDALSQGRAPQLAELPIQYGDYAIWQRARLAGPAVGRLVAYWRQRLEGAPRALDIPADRPRPATPSGRGATYGFALAHGASESLRALGRSTGATMFMALLTGFVALLHRISGETDIVIGAPVASRPRAELEPLIGFFLNTLVLRTDVAGDPSFRELLLRVRETTLGAYAHQDLPFERLVSEVAPQRSPGQNPLFQVMFTMNAGPSGGPRPGRPSIDVGTASAKFDLMLSLAESDQGLTASFEYSTDLFERATIERMAGWFERLLVRAAEAPTRPLSRIDLLGPGEREAILALATTPGDRDEGACVHALFEAQVARTPDAIAVTDGRERLPYAELARRATRLARRLGARGVGPGVCVCLSVSRTAALPVAVLGVLLAGGAYVPLDPAYPADRLAFMAADAGARVLVTERALAASLPAADTTLFLDDDDDEPSEPPAHSPSRPVGPDDLAYVIYTSGSTGRPKGVAMPHRALASLVRWQAAARPATSGLRTLQLAPASFDVSFQEMLCTLASGGTLVIATDEARKDPALLLRLCADERVERLFLPCVALQQLAEAAAHWEARMPGLREVVSAGEQLRVTPAIAGLFSRMPGCVLFNQYGPTETHVVTERALAGDPASWPVLPPIGRPVAGARAYVLDARQRPAPLGVPGELFIGGTAVSRGYRDRPAATAERYLPDPFATALGARMYRTGDRARWLATGDLEFLGRADDQLKIRGFRVEPGEIEAALASHPAVAEAAVVAQARAGGDARLVAHVVLAGDAAEAPVGELRAHLRRVLPDYMVPATIERVVRLPLTPSGKVDRRALAARAPAPEAPRRGRRARTKVEHALEAIFCEVLGAAEIAVDDDFFELGGHSLLATQVVSRVRDALGVEITLRQLFEAPTVEALGLAVLQLELEAHGGLDGALLLAELDRLTDEGAHDAAASGGRNEGG